MRHAPNEIINKPCKICGRICKTIGGLGGHEKSHDPAYRKQVNDNIRKTKYAELNPHWRGEAAGYFARHDFIRRRFSKPKTCTMCDKATSYLDLANISGEYKRDLSDWQYLCRRCHMLTDGRMEKLHPERRSTGNWHKVTL